MRRNILFCFLLASAFSIQSSCKESKPEDPGTPPGVSGPTISYWITKGDQSALLQKQTTPLSFNSTTGQNYIEVDSAQTYQTIDGFGYALTGGSAFLLNRLPASDKTSVLQELFGSGENSLGVSYLRISIGASDLDPQVFSYDDLPAGQTDVNLTQFNLSKDTVDLIPLLKQILAINPSIKILGSPWSPPTWMKDNGNSVGGSLLPQYYDAYARYFVKYIQAMKANGITIHAITPQNEPLYGGNNPSMVMQAAQEKDFIKNNLGPAFQAAAIVTKIIVYDHNCDRPDYPTEILSDAAARAFVDGSAFHLYAGDVSALSTVHNAYPDKNVYFTEQWTGANETFSSNLKWHLKNVIIGTMRNWSKVSLEWNLANDPNYNPHTAGGCSECKGALTIGASITRNVSYYIIGHVSRFVPPGSIRISSTQLGDLSTVAFLTPQGKKVLVVENDGNIDATVRIKYKGQFATTSLPAGAVGTYVW
jgi:glucosylceramidase